MFTKHPAAFFASLFLASAAIAAPVQAQQALTLKGEVMLVKSEVAEDGTVITKLVSPDVAVPGDRVVFSTKYQNNITETVANTVIRNPLNPAVRLADDTDPDLSVSVDDGVTWGKLADLTITNEDGTTRAAVAADVTHVRWTIEKVEPGESGSVEFQAIIR